MNPTENANSTADNKPEAVPQGAVPLIDDVSSEKLDATEEKMIWKLFKGKTVLLFRLCGSCQYKMFHDKEKWTRNEEGIDVKFHLCHRCVRVNYKTTNLLAPTLPKKSAEKKVNEQ